MQGVISLYAWHQPSRLHVLEPLERLARYEARKYSYTKSKNASFPCVKLSVADVLVQLYLLVGGLTYLLTVI